MKHLSEALSKSMINKLDKHKSDISNDYYIVIIRNLNDIVKEYKDDIIYIDNVAPFMIKPKKEALDIEKKYGWRVNIYEIIKNKYFSKQEFIDDYINTTCVELKLIK